MDPFYQVLQDCEDQVSALKSADLEQRDFAPQLEELHETIEDLKDTIDQIKNEPEIFGDLSPMEIAKREKEVERMVRDYQELQNSYKNSSKKPFMNYDEVDNNDITHKVEQNNQQMIQQELRYQDEQLDDVYGSMVRINEQAKLMGSELENQATIMGEFEEDFDRTQGRLKRNMKNLTRIVERNKERFNDCCIVLLIFVLIVLLVMIAIV